MNDEPGGTRRPSDLGALAAWWADGAPETPAVIGLSVTIGRAAFAQRCTDLARRLVQLGVRPGDRVGVAIHKDLDAYVAAHGVVAAGAVVVPVDPMGPAEGLRRIALDSEMSALLLGSLAHRRFASVVAHLDALEGRTLVGDGSSFGTDATGLDDVELPPPPASDDPAYIIFTSGSTGVPKGIVHSHASALAYAERASAHLAATDRVAGMSPFHFDMSTLELWAAPLARATVVAMGEAHLRMPASLTERSAAEGVTLWYTVPSLLEQVLDRGALDERDPTLRSIWFAGETMAPGTLAELRSRFPGVEMVNVYGPAEVNECTRWTARPDDIDDCPIGVPWDGVELRIVEPDAAEMEADDIPDVVDGSPGELWVSAPTVMTGYWRRPDLDAAGLVPRADGPDWYRTGDLVRRDADGVLRFLGRRDHQVKVQGVRVELEAVEAALGSAPGVRHAVAAPAPGGSRLDAVVVLRDPDAAVDEAALRRWCAARLPGVAVPASIVVAAHLPETATGKIDRAAVRRDLTTPSDAGVAP